MEGETPRGGLRLRFVDLGDGPAVLLLHGFSSSFAGTWARHGWPSALVEAGRRVVGLDFPGHGGSERAPDADRCRPGELVADVLAVLDARGIERADVVGFSMGGGVALHLAAAAPRRVRRLAVAGVGDAGINGRHDPHALARGVERIRASAAARGLDRRALEPYLGGPGWPAGLDEPLPPIAAPVLLVVAGRDRYMGGTARTEAWLAHAEVLRRPERDHYDVLADPVARDGVLRFLA